MLDTLKDRFGRHPQRHEGISWDEVEASLKQHPEALDSLMAMEESGGEPDVIGRDPNTGCILICDCSAETPAKRRSLCYDDEALRKRKRNPPKGSASEQATQMGISLMSEDEYYHLQELGEFDLKTSSWIATPPQIRARGGALFCEKRYGRTFTFHNGADSYYAARGWRGILRLPA
ncbi:MAG: DUF4256 domain-containing protein [Coriobacteriales bacterium]|nr:DUF4256 domain-containing protein [Coriobacteriales bacterium]